MIVLGLIGLKMEKFSSKNENVLNNSQTSERDLVIDILKKISDLETELKWKNVIIDYLHSQISSKATDNSFSSSAPGNLNGTSTQDSVGNKITESFHSNTAMISKHRNPTIKSSNQQSYNSQIKRKILVAGDVNARMKNFCKQKDIGWIDNCNLEKHHLGTKKLHLNKKGNSAFAKKKNFAFYWKLNCKCWYFWWN